MKCDGCKGTGDGARVGDHHCSLCNGSGVVCDICGSPADPGETICADCLLDEDA